MPAYRRADFVIVFRVPDLSAAAETSSLPMPKAEAPARIKSTAVSRFTPPVGINGTCGNGAFNDLMYFAPPTAPQVKTLTQSLPDFQAFLSSVCVSAPAR